MEDRQEDLAQLIANSRQWHEFAGIKHSADCIRRKASALASVLALEQAVWDVEALQSSGVQFGINKNFKRWCDVYYDHLLYYIHVADREALEFLGDRRVVSMERLGADVAEICSLEFADDKQVGQFKARFFENLNLFQKDFRSYKRGKGVPLVEQLEYQFTKRIASRLDRHPAFAASVVIVITLGEILLNRPGLLTREPRTK